MLELRRRQRHSTRSHCALCKPLLDAFEPADWFGPDNRLIGDVQSDLLPELQDPPAGCNMFDEHVTESRPVTAIDEAGARVLAFQMRVQNLGRIGDLTSNLERIATSGDWRDYTTAVGRERWQDSEFDYFLIASGVFHEDAQRVIQWAKAGPKLAAMMDPAAAPDRRRPLEEAAKSWHSAGPASFLQRARELGWLARDDSVKVAVSKRALDEARTGVTNEEHARQGRLERLTSARRDQLDKLVETLLLELTAADERRYVSDQLRKSVRGEQRRPADPRGDAERLGWNVSALAKQWGVARMTAHRWVEEVRDPA